MDVIGTLELKRGISTGISTISIFLESESTYNFGYSHICRPPLKHQT